MKRFFLSPAAPGQRERAQSGAMIRIISVLLALCLMAACGLAGAEEAANTGKPYANPNLLTEFPEQPGPEENYFIYANYDALVKAVDDPRSWVNDDRGRGYYYLAEQVLEICQNPEYTDTESQIARIVYNLAVDAEKRKADGYAALAEKVSRVKAVKTTEELTALLGEKGFLINTPFFTTITQPSGSGADLYVVAAFKTPVLPTVPTDSWTEQPETDKETPRETLIRMQYSEEEARALVDEIERYDNDYVMDPVPWVEKPQVSLREIRENCQPLYALLSGVGLVTEGDETLPVYETGAGDIATFEAWYTDENLEIMKAIVVLRLCDDAAAFLEKEKDSNFAAYNHSEGMLLFDEIYHAVRIPMDQAYITHYCPPERWEMATSLFEETREAMRARILANTWLSDESKKKAIEKLDDLCLSQITPPDGPFDCEPLLESLRGCGNMLDASALCQQFYNLCKMSFVGGKVEKTNPYTSGNGVMGVGGQYLPQYNMFCIGAPALAGSFCDSTSRATLLGTLGVHIAHEVSHGYDSLGAMQDLSGTGTLFTEEDLATFNGMTAAIAAQLDRIETGNGFHVMGDQVLYEAMADLTGVCLMLDLAKQDESFDYEAFFLSFARFFHLYDVGNDYHPDEDGRVESHPPYYVRVNYTVAQFEEFYRTYPSVTEGTPMYVAPENRILPW